MGAYLFALAWRLIALEREYIRSGHEFCSAVALGALFIALLGDACRVLPCLLRLAPPSSLAMGRDVPDSLTQWSQLCDRLVAHGIPENLLRDGYDVTVVDTLSRWSSQHNLAWLRKSARRRPL
jgi:hypothetical protein